jgi:hypothetical protein
MHAPKSARRCVGRARTPPKTGLRLRLRSPRRQRHPVDTDGPAPSCRGRASASCRGPQGLDAPPCLWHQPGWSSGSHLDPGSWRSVAPCGWRASQRLRSSPEHPFDTEWVLPDGRVLRRYRHRATLTTSAAVYSNRSLGRASAERATVATLAFDTDSVCTYHVLREPHDIRRRCAPREGPQAR